MGSPLGPFRPGTPPDTSIHHDEYDPAGPVEDAQPTPNRLSLPENAKVVGIADADNQIGVYGFSPGNVGVRARSGTGVAIHAQGAVAAGVFEGDVRVTGQLKVTGSGNFGGDIEVR